MTFAAAPYFKYNRQAFTGRLATGEIFRNDCWRQIVAAFEQCGVSVKTIASRTGLNKRKVKKVLKSPATLDGNSLGLSVLAEMCWAMDVTPTVSLRSKK